MSGFSVDIAALRAQLAAKKSEYHVAVSQLEPLQNEINTLQGQIQAALGDYARGLYQASGKVSGDATFEIDGAGKFKAAISKSVKWDGSKLQQIAASMPWERAVSVFNIDFSVSEKNYEAAQKLDPQLAEQLLAARTVKYGDMKIVAVD